MVVESIYEINETAIVVPIVIFDVASRLKGGEAHQVRPVAKAGTHPNTNEPLVQILARGPR